MRFIHFDSAYDGMLISPSRLTSLIVFVLLSISITIDSDKFCLTFRYLQRLVHKSSLDLPLCFRHVSLVNSYDSLQIVMMERTPQNNSSGKEDEESDAGSGKDVGTVGQEPHQGTPHQSTSQQGTTPQGTTHQGTAHQGTTQRGATHQTATNQGTAHEGTAHQGTAYQFAANEGTVQQDEAPRELERQDAAGAQETATEESVWLTLWVRVMERLREIMRGRTHREQTLEICGLTMRRAVRRTSECQRCRKGGSRRVGYYRFIRRRRKHGKKQKKRKEKKQRSKKQRSKKPREKKQRSKKRREKKRREKRRPEKEKCNKKQPRRRRDNK